MLDKYHNEWIMKDIVTEYRIVKAQLRTFHFLSDMAYDLNNAIEMLEGNRHLPAMFLQLDLMNKKCFYLALANSIGRLWRVDDDSV